MNCSKEKNKPTVLLCQHSRKQNKFISLIVHSNVTKVLALFSGSIPRIDVIQANAAVEMILVSVLVTE